MAEWKRVHLPKQEMQEAGVPSRGRKTPRGGNGNPFQYLASRIPWTEKPGGSSPRGCKESGTTKATEHSPGAPGSPSCLPTPFYTWQHFLPHPSPNQALSLR